MSEFEVRIPDLGDAQDVEVVEICVAIGDQVQVDDALIVIESDKASMEVPAPVAGTIESIQTEIGNIIETNELIAKINLETEAAQTSIEESVEERELAEVDGVDLDERNSVSEQNQELISKITSNPIPASDSTEARFEIRLPELGDVDEVEVVEVLAFEGAQIDVDQPLVTLESDKATMEIPSTVQGLIESLAVSVGDKVTDNSLIAIIRSSQAKSAETGSTSEIQSQNQSEGAPADVPDSVPTATEKPSTPTKGPSKSSSHIYAGPAVRRLARELGVDLGHVNGTGSKNRIVKDDLKNFVKQQMQQTDGVESTGLPEVVYPDFSKFGEIEEVPLTRIQVRGVKNLVPSWLNVVHVTQHDEADVTDLEAFRSQLNDRGGSKDLRFTILPFILKSVAATLHEHPVFNASLHPQKDRLILKKYINLGIAVDTPDGLVVPVVRNVLDKGLSELAAEVDRLSQAARDKKLTPDDVSGATFTVSSLGRLGGTGFTPVVNAPELSILGVARLDTKPVWDGSQFVPRQVLPLSLSYDHRAINGADGGRFMQSLIEKLTDVRLLIL